MTDWASTNGTSGGGLYPNLIKAEASIFRHFQLRFRTRAGEQVFLHPSSLCFKDQSYPVCPFLVSGSLGRVPVPRRGVYTQHTTGGGGGCLLVLLGARGRGATDQTNVTQLQDIHHSRKIGEDVFSSTYSMKRG